MAQLGVQMGRFISVCGLACADASRMTDSGLSSGPEMQGDETEPPAPMWSVDEVGEQMEHFMAMGVPSGREITRVYEELMSHGDGICPSDGEVFESLNEGCISAEGYRYTGIGWLHYGAKRPADGAPLEWSHGGDFEITRPDGSVLAGGGEMVMSLDSGASLGEALDDSELLERATDADTWALDVYGSWVDDSRSDWLGQGFSGVIHASVREDRSTGEAMAHLHGGLAVGDQDLFFDETTWYGDGRCEQGVIGTLRLRDPRGYWVAWELGLDCDACGELVFHEDQPLGELCVDLSSWSRQLYAAWAPN